MDWWKVTLRALLIATSLIRPQTDGQMIARCLNPMEQPLTLREGSSIGTYTAVDTGQIQELQLDAVSTVSQIQESHSYHRPLPKQVRPFFDADDKNCHGSTETGGC